MSERALEIKVGVFILGAAAILIAFAVAIGDLSFGRTWRLHVEYGFAGAIHSGAPVRVSGQQVGRVSRVELIQEERRDSNGSPLLVRLTLDLEERARGILREDTELHIATAGVLGEAYVDAVTGRMSGAPLVPGATVRGTDSPRTDLLLARAHGLVETLAGIVEEDGETARELIHSLNRLAAIAERALGEDSEGLTHLLARLGAVADDLGRLSSKAHAQLDDGDLAVLLSSGRRTMEQLRRELPDLLASLRSAGAQLDSTAKLLSSLDESDLDRAREALERYEAAGARIEGLAVDAQALLDRIERGEGTLGALLNDEQVYDDLRYLLEDLRSHPWKLLRRR